MDSFLQDLRYTFRTLARRPGFAALAVLTLAVGIGVNTVAFSAVNALLLRPFKAADADRVGWVLISSPGNPHGSASPLDFEELARGSLTFAALAAEGRLPVSLHTESGAEQAWSMLVSGAYFGTIGARAEIGRVLSESDVATSDLVAVVSHRFWTERLDRGSIAGRSIVLNGRSFSVIGVMPDDFQGPGGLYTPDVWLPLERRDVLNLPASLRSGEWLTLVGRLRDGVAPAQADAELSAMSQSLPRAPGKEATRRTIRFYPMAGGHPDLQGIGRVAWVAMAVVGLVLLIACFNVAALLMARASERQREIGVRSALGASRGRILRQLVTEGTVLAAVSGTATLVIAAWSGTLLSTFSLPAPIPQKLHLGIDGTLIAFTIALVIVAGVFPAVIPALQATRANLVGSLRVESRLGGRPSRTRNAFVVAQVAGSTLFLAAASLFVRSFLNSTAFDPGFDVRHAAVIQLSPSLYGYDDGRARVMVEALQQRISAVPGVLAVGASDRVPFYVGFPKSVEYSNGADDCSITDCRRATEYAVSPSHFEALGIAIQQGRAFNPGDAATASSVVVSAHMAALLWPGESPIGRTVRLGDKGRPVEVIGIAADIKHRNMNEPIGAFVYRPIAPDEWADEISLAIRTSGDPAAVLAAVREQARSIDPAMPVTVTTMTERMKIPLWPVRTAAGFFLICGALALLLATVGLFGVLYFTVTQRTREFGIRVALGATSRRVMAVVLKEGLVLAAIGVTLGGAAAYVAARFLSRALFEVQPGDPVSFAATVTIQLAVALLACGVPAWRATRADPMIALRQD